MTLEVFFYIGCPKEDFICNLAKRGDDRLSALAITSLPRASYCD